MLDQGVLPAEIYQTQAAYFFKQLSRNCFFLLKARSKPMPTSSC